VKLSGVLQATCAHSFALRCTETNIFKDAKAKTYLGFNAQGVVAHEDAKETHVLAPVFAPRVATNPILPTGFTIGAPPHDRDNVIGHHVPGRRVVDNAAGVGQERIGIDRSRDRSPGIYFGFDLVRHQAETAGKVRIGAKLGNGRIGKAWDGVTGPGAVAGATRIQGRAGQVQWWTKADRGIGAAGNVGHAGIVGDETGFVLDKVVHARRRAAVARTGRGTATIQNILNRQVDFIENHRRRAVIAIIMTERSSRHGGLGNLYAIA
jgi:hypothetical protein